MQDRGAHSITSIRPVYLITENQDLGLIWIPRPGGNFGFTISIRATNSGLRSTRSSIEPIGAT